MGISLFATPVASHAQGRLLFVMFVSYIQVLSAAFLIGLARFPLRITPTL